MTVTELPANSTDRLMAVADIIETRPQAYRQDNWWTERTSAGFGVYDPAPSKVYGKASAEPECHTVGCIAGWAVALSPVSTRTPSWPIAGAEALGVSPPLASYLFSAHFEAPAAIVADILRRIARLPEGERTFSNMPLVLNDDQLRLLLGISVAVGDYDEDDEDDGDEEVEPYPAIEPGPDEGAPEPVDGNGADPVDAPVLVPA